MAAGARAAPAAGAVVEELVARLMGWRRDEYGAVHCRLFAQRLRIYWPPSAGGRAAWTLEIWRLWVNWLPRGYDHWSKGPLPHGSLYVKWW